MSFLTRVRLAIVRWWVRNAEDRRRFQHPHGWEDLEGMGRRLARSPLPYADDDEYPPVSAPVPVKPAAFPKRLVIRFDV